MSDIIAENYFEIGNLLSKKGNLIEASIAYKKARKNNNKNYLYCLSLAETLEEMGDFNQANKFYQQAIKLNSNLDYLLQKIGQIYKKIGCWIKAEQYYKKILETFPEERLKIYLDLGEILLQQNKVEEAISYYHKLLEYQPKSLQAHLKLGLAYGKIEEWEKAKVFYNQALAIQPECYEANLGLGMVFTAQGIIEEAISYYKRALNNKPNDARAYQKNQSLLAQSSILKDTKIQSLYEDLESQPNDYNLYYKLGKVLSQKGLIEEAIEAYLKVIQINPTFTQVYGEINHATLYIEDIDKVISTYRQVIDKYPDFIPAYINLAVALTRQGKIQQAQFYKKKAVHYKTLRKLPDLTHRKKSERQPNFIIIGAEKCGTSSLYSYITKHPQVLGAIEKEIHFFTYNFDYGLDWYLSHFPKLPLGYLTGEASTSYIGCHNNAHRRLFNLFPEVKILAILRDPIDRAISHYHQLVRLGREGRRLEEVINQEIEILADFDSIWELRQSYWKIGKGTIWHSLYVYFLEEWLKIFPSEQLLILKSDSLFNHPEITMQKVWNFLRLPEYKIRNYNQQNSGGSYDKIDKRMYQKMVDFFEPHNQKLEQLLTNYNLSLSAINFPIPSN